MIHETVKETIKYLSTMDEDDIILVPQLWTKAIAEGELKDETDLEVVLTEEQWKRSIELYYSDDYATYETLIKSVITVIGAEFNPENWTWSLPKETK